MLQSHSPDGFGDPLRLVFLERERLRGLHRAKSAGARAALARDHHGRGALAPAFPAIRALRAFANGVQTQIGNERLGRKEDRIRRQSDFDPGRFLRLVQRGIDLGAGHHGEAIRAGFEKQSLLSLVNLGEARDLTWNTGANEESFV